MSHNVYITRKIPEPAIDLLKSVCQIVEVNPEDRTLTKQELIKQIKGRHGLLCLLNDTIDAEVIQAADRLKGIANYAVGYDNIDINAATERKILVTNTPGVLTDATAELAWALLFSVARRIVESDKFTRSGKFSGWAPMLFLGADITSSTLGIIGAGRIGTAMALKSKGFKIKIFYYDKNRNNKIEKQLRAKKTDLKTLLKQSDFISIHLPLTPETRHIIGEEELNLMKPTAYLINTSRGPIIDESALINALKTKKIAGAALDVYENEPELKRGLAQLDNVVLSPHIGSATTSTRTKMAIIAAENLIAILQGRKPPNLINPRAYR